MNPMYPITSNSNPHVRVMSNDFASMLRIREIGMLPERQRTAALREWQAEQQQAKQTEQECAA